MANLDAGYFLERDTSLFGTAFLQTLEPRAFYLWVDREDPQRPAELRLVGPHLQLQPLFRTTRFSGHDRIADANQASLSVTSRLIDDENGLERVTASVGQIFYFEDRDVRVCDAPRAQSSPAAARACRPRADGATRKATMRSRSPARRLPRKYRSARRAASRSRARRCWTCIASSVNEGGAFVHWTPDTQTDLNAGYRYRREQTSYDDFRQPDQRDDRPAIFRPYCPSATAVRYFTRYQTISPTTTARGAGGTGIQFSAAGRCAWSIREGVTGTQGRDYGFYCQFVCAASAASQEHRPAVAGQIFALAAI